MEDGVDPHSGEEPQKPEAVVVAPTRELAIQIKEEARKFSSGSTIKPVVAYGGTSVGFQLSTLFKGMYKDIFMTIICTEIFNSFHSMEFRMLCFLNWELFIFFMHRFSDRWLYFETFQFCL